MARAAVSGRLAGRLVWRVANLVAVRDETSTARTLVLDVPDWPGHLPGQHVDVRLTAPDGYSTERSYSLSAPEDDARIELTVQLLRDGEVSPYLASVLHKGDPLELRGPVGGWFVWDPEAADDSPVLLVGGGSGIAPLMAMLRARHKAGSSVRFRLVYSVRSPNDVYFAEELGTLGELDGVEVSYVWTRATPDGWPEAPRRIQPDDVVTAGFDPDTQPRVFVCGPTGFVEAVADMLVAAGHNARRVKTERFGPTGGGA